MATSTIENKDRANKLGEATSLTQGVMYTFPADGYLICSCAPSNQASAAVEVYGATNDTIYFRLGGYSNNTYATWSMFVRKGMRAKPYTITNTGAVVFRPLQ